MSHKSTIDTLGSLLDAAPYGVIICDPAGHMVFVNKLAMKMYGQVHRSKSPSDWPKHAKAFRNGKVLAARDYPMSKALRGELVSDMELDVSSTDTGKKFRIAVSAHPLIEDGEMVGAMSVHRFVDEKSN